MKTQKKVILFIVLLLGILLIPSVVNGAYKDTFTATNGITAKKVVNNADGTIQLQFENIELVSGNSYTWSIGKTSDVNNVSYTANLETISSTNKTVTIDLSTSVSSIATLLKETNDAYISIKNATTGAYVVQALKIDLTLPAMKAFKVNKVTESNSNLAYTLSANGNATKTLPTTYGIKDVSYKFVEITDVDVLTKYNKAITDKTDLSTLTCFATPDKAGNSGWKTGTSNNTGSEEVSKTGILASDIPTKQGVYYMWLKGEGQGIKTVYGYSIISVDTGAPTVKSIQVVSPKAGTYGSSEKVTIRVNFDEAIIGELTPTLKIRFGDSQTRELENGKISNSADNYYIEYTYDIQDFDVGQLATVNLVGGNIKDSSGKSAQLTCPQISGNTIKANEGRTLLTNEELSSMEEFLNKDENNGFLMSNYNSPEKIYMYYVVLSYNKFGADKAGDKEYREAVGEVFAPIFKITTAQVKTILKEKTGLDRADISGWMSDGFLYIPKYDAYYTSEAVAYGTPVNCFYGYKQDDGTYVVEYVRMEINASGRAFTQGKVTLKKVNETFQFVANTVKLDQAFPPEKEIDGNKGTGQGTGTNNGGNKDDGTTIPSKIPQTGEGTVMIIAIAMIAGVGIVFFIKNRKYRDIK